MSSPPFLAQPIASDTACGWAWGGKPRQKEKGWWKNVADCAIKGKNILERVAERWR